MNNDATTSLEQILSSYVPLNLLPAIVHDIRHYYMSIVTDEVDDLKQAKHLRQKIVRS